MAIQSFDVSEKLKAGLNRSHRTGLVDFNQFSKLWKAQSLLKPALSKFKAILNRPYLAELNTLAGLSKLSEDVKSTLLR